jgi:hypothetical protein
MAFYSFTAADCSRSAEFRGLKLALVCLPWLLSACPVDDRRLSASLSTGGAQNQASDASLAAQPGADDSVATGGGNAGDPDTAGSAGQAGEPGAATPEFVDGCADLDSDRVSDCTESAVANSEFDTDVSHWTAEANATLVWSSRDLLGEPGSGSALVTSSDEIDAAGDSFAAAEQCVAVSTGQVIDIFAISYIDADQVAGRASISLWFFPTAGCPGDTSSEVYETTEQFATQTVISLRGTKAVPDGMQSMRVRLGAIKPFQADSFSVRFDDVLIHAH